MLPPEILARARYLHERIRDLSKSVIEAGTSGVPSESASHLSAIALATEEARQPSTGSDQTGDRSPAVVGEADFLFWKKQLSGGGYDRFTERLHSLGISEQDAVFLSQESSFPDEQPGSSAAVWIDRD